MKWVAYRNYVAQRRAALLALDEARIRENNMLYQIPTSKNDVEFWASVHLERLGLRSLVDTEKLESRKWLFAHGWVPDDSRPLGWRLAHPEMYR